MLKDDNISNIGSVIATIKYTFITLESESLSVPVCCFD